VRYSLPPLFNPVIRVDSSVYAWSIGKFLILLGTLLLGGYPDRHCDCYV
jgi:two-component system, NtrC family, response regulator HydG